MLTYQPFIGGSTPLYPDYVVFGAFQWVRVMSPYQTLGEGRPDRRTGSSAASTSTAGSAAACAAA